ncbi:putative cupintype [Favolaschia claudopus]|uniref:Cupintype n=1 Tax=Favolaschia claudopus TaxID=2862362 RepID=A0AAW0CER1_9AGAR
MSTTTPPTPGDPLTDSTWSLQRGITMTILSSPGPSGLRSRVHCTPTSKKLYVPPHWHAAHDEEHVVIKGRLIVMQDGVKRIFTPEDGPCVTKRGVVHSLEAFEGEELIFEEMSYEMTEQKTYFFRNLAVPGIMSSPLRILQIFYYGDTYPKLPTGLRWLEVPLIVGFGGWLASLLGYKLPDDRLRLDPKRFPRDKKD